MNPLTIFIDDFDFIYALDVSERSKTPKTFGTLYMGDGVENLIGHAVGKMVCAKQPRPRREKYYINDNDFLTIDEKSHKHFFGDKKLRKIRKKLIKEAVENRISQICEQREN